MIVTMQGHIGVPHFLAALGLSMLVFKPKWKACIEAGPRSMLFAALFVIGIFALVTLKNPATTESPLRNEVRKCHISSKYRITFLSVWAVDAQFR
jgi:hypothetical protein